MRKISFRGKCYDDGEWIFGSLLDDDIIVTKGAVEVDEDYINIFDEWSSILQETVGQYTGFKDTNEKRIFEGDVLIQQGCSSIYIVFDEKTASLGWSFTDFIRSQGYIHQLTKYDMSCCEIVGNIHDNPEFLSN